MVIFAFILGRCFVFQLNDVHLEKNIQNKNLSFKLALYIPMNQRKLFIPCSHQHRSPTTRSTNNKTQYLHYLLCFKCQLSKSLNVCKVTFMKIFFLCFTGMFGKCPIGRSVLHFAMAAAKIVQWNVEEF